MILPIKLGRSSSPLCIIQQNQGILSGQIIIFHQPRFPWNKGISLTKPPFGVRSCEVAIIWPDFVWLLKVHTWKHLHPSRNPESTESTATGLSRSSSWYMEESFQQICYKKPQNRTENSQNDGNTQQNHGNLRKQNWTEWTKHNVVVHVLKLNGMMETTQFSYFFLHKKKTSHGGLLKSQFFFSLHVKFSGLLVFSDSDDFYSWSFCCDPFQNILVQIIVWLFVSSPQIGMNIQKACLKLPPSHATPLKFNKATFLLGQGHNFQGYTHC